MIREMLMYRSAVIGALALALAIPFVATSANAVTPSNVTVKPMTVNGTGCPAGTAAVAVSPDNEAFTVTYSDYIAQGDPGDVTSARKFCQLALEVKFPQGFTFAVAKADYRGYLDLQRGTRAIIDASYYFAGDSATASDSETVSGPVEANWQLTNAMPSTSLVYRACGSERLLNVKSSLRIDPASSSQSYISMDSTDVSYSTIFNFTWKRC
jgi:Domain of unknown function (DUF4360)